MTNEVPAGACTFRCEFELADNGDDAKSAPFSMVARTGDAIEHWYWGSVVHDLAGMNLPSRGRVPIDFNHNPDEVVGYANRFSSESGDLEVRGALTPYGDSDRASEIIAKGKAGVPWEASINFGGDGIRTERVPEGMHVEVNGREFAGPITVIREWPLRGVAVCPYGADGGTQTEFNSPITYEVTEMSNDTTTEVAEVEETVDATTDDQATSETTDTATAVVEDVQPDNAAAVGDGSQTELAGRAAEGARFIEAFGEKGAVWFAQGLTFEAARAEYTAALQAENESLKARLAAIETVGETEHVEFSESDQPSKKTGRTEKERKQGVTELNRGIADALNFADEPQQTDTL